MKIIFFDTKPYDRIYFDAYIKEHGHEVVYIEERLGASTVRLAEGHDAVCVFVNDNVNADIINALYGYGVKVLLLRCAGYNNVDVQAAYKKIHIMRVPAYSPYAVAEHAAALLMSVNRKTHRAYVRTRDFNFNINGFVSRDLHGKTAGVIGTGRIGRIMIDILNGFGMKVVAYDKFQVADLPAKYVTLDELFEYSDVISIHCPLTEETKHLINAESIKRMKDHVMIINTSRGGIIDTHALIDGLITKKIGGVGLDVYEEEEQYFYEDRSNDIVGDEELVRLLAFPNVLLTSHQAFLTAEALEAIARVSMDNLDMYMGGKFLENEVCYQCEMLGNCESRKKQINCF